MAVDLFVGDDRDRPGALLRKRSGEGSGLTGGGWRVWAIGTDGLDLVVATERLRKAQSTQISSETVCVRDR